MQLTTSTCGNSCYNITQNKISKSFFQFKLGINNIIFDASKFRVAL